MKNINIKIADITGEDVCAVVNAANSSLLGGGGVDGAIHSAGGEQILKECKELRATTYPNGLPTGEAVATHAGNMKADYIIHTVGPVYILCKDRCEELLRNCYINSLKVARALGCESISFPAISTGIYGYPKHEAARVAYKAVKDFLEDDDTIEVNFVFRTRGSYDLFTKAIKYSGI